MRKGERGNVLFLILIAVALFAALSYAVTSSSRSGGGDAGGETSLINSAQITQYPASVRTAIIRMIVRGVTTEQLLFDDPGEFGTATTGIDTAADEERAVFHPNGGGATYVTAPPEVMESGNQGTWFFSSFYEVGNIGTSEIGAATSALGNDVIAFLPGIKQAICVKLNEEIGITGGTDADGDGVPVGPTTKPNINLNMERGAGTGSEGEPGIGDAAPATTHEIDDIFAGQAYGCYDADDANDDLDQGDFIYYHVLVER